MRPKIPANLFPPGTTYVDDLILPSPPNWGDLVPMLVTKVTPNINPSMNSTLAMYSPFGTAHVKGYPPFPPKLGLISSFSPSWVLTLIWSMRYPFLPETSLISALDREDIQEKGNPSLVPNYGVFFETASYPGCMPYMRCKFRQLAVKQARNRIPSLKVVFIN